MRFGIGSYTFTWALGVPGYGDAAMTVEGLIDRGAAMECSVVQLCDNVPLSEASDATLAEWRRRAEARGMKLQVGTRGVDLGQLLDFLRIAEAAGAELVRSMLPKTGRGSDIADAAAMLSEALPEYERRGVLLSLENHDLHRCAELRRLVDEIASPNLGICLDTVNSFGAAEDPERVIDALLPVTNCLHIKDFAISRVDHQMGFVVNGAPAGEGMLDIKKLLAELAARRTDAAVILELWTPYADDVAATIAVESEWADKSVGYLRPLLREYDAYPSEPDTARI